MTTAAPQHSEYDSPPATAYTDDVVQPGQILAGKFQIERVLGEGGMGVVVAAQHLQLGQRVALKFLLREALANPVVAERFLREARATVKLKSEHVGRVIDVGQLDDGAPYIVMEYLDGCDLQQFLAQHAKLPVAQAVDFCLQAAEAVAEAHSLGIIHRDLKPANLFLTVRADGGALVKVLDFGISKATGETEDFSLTRTATVMGSPGYMSPEQLRSARDVDARTDVWAFGVILYELVAGVAPFAAESITELTLKVAMDPVPPMDPSVPAGFAAVIHKCLAKDPAQRFGSIAELAAALAPFGPPGSAQQAQRIARVQAGLATNVHKSAAMSAAMAATAGVPTTLSASVIATPEEAPRRRYGLAIGAAAVVAAAIVTIAILAGGGGRGSGAEAAPAVHGASGGAAPAVAPAAGSAAATDPAVAPAAGTGAPAAGSAVAIDPAAAPDAGVAVEPAAGSAAVPSVGSAGKPSAGSGKSGRRGGRGSGAADDDDDDDDDFSNSRH